jgi:hypothetical protein
VYFRIEDPDYSFALGILIPELSLATCDQNWDNIKVVKDPNNIYKQVRLQNLSVFLDRDNDLCSIDKILDIDPSGKDTNYKAFFNELD